MSKEQYYEGIGRRKSSTSRVRIYPISQSGTKSKVNFTINNVNYDDYFKVLRQRREAIAPLEAISDKKNKVRIEAKTKGGGTTGQAEAIKLGLARALVKWDPDFKSEMKARGFLTRDARVVERKKYGLRKARRAQQWRKR